MDTGASKILYAYWNEVRGDRIAPRRFEIEPARLAPVLPDAFILERVGDLTIRYRLAGTRILDRFGMEFRGTSFFDGFGVEDRHVLEHQVRNMVQCGGGTLMHWECRSQSGRTATLECLVLPLVHMRSTVDRFVGVIGALDGHDWLGDEPLTERQIVACHTLWPEGEPAVVPFPQVPTALDKHMRSARIVRTNQRSFRVYDGGLAHVDHDES